jgi:pyruvate/2-oxoglutarate/acetoin dehydrogenase E1 component
VNTTVLADLNHGLRECFEESSDVVFWGEDILAPYGGAFKVSGDLSERFSNRVFTTPISEGAIVGLGVGAAMRGLKPVVELMFGDFVTLAADQLINHAAKFPGMFNGEVNLPLVVRTPMGGYRGYGPTHSQSLEKHFLGVPGLRVVAVNLFCSPGRLLKNAILYDPMPTLFIENKTLYPKQLINNGMFGFEIDELNMDTLYPDIRIRNYYGDVAGDVTVLSYGGMSALLGDVLNQLKDEEIRVDLFMVTEISRSEVPEIVIDSVRQTGRLLTCEEGAGDFGFGSQMIAKIVQNLGSTYCPIFKTVTADNTVIPSDKSLEEAMLPSSKGLIESIIELIQQ